MRWSLHSYAIIDIRYMPKCPMSTSTPVTFVYKQTSSNEIQPKRNKKYSTQLFSPFRFGFLPFLFSFSCLFYENVPIYID